MTTPEQTGNQPLTRKQLREIRNTGSNPIIDTGAVPLPAQGAVATQESPDEEVSPPPVEASLAPVAHLPRAAEPIVLPEAPGPDRGVDLGVSPLTRRQARQQERIRTASVPVITPDLAAAFGSASTSDDPVAPATDAVIDAVPENVAASTTQERPEELVEIGSDDESAPTEAVEEGEKTGEPLEDAPVVVAEIEQTETPIEVGETTEVKPAAADEATEEEPEEAPRTVAPDFGAALLAGDAASSEPLPPSFDELIAHSSTGSVATPNALILSQVPDGGSIVAPVNATGEVLITGSLNLPEGLGSTGHAAGTADGKEVDAVLVDGELPAHSSPTPIAASAAISTVKSPGEIIKPPAPEKGGRLMLTLAITAGALALALVGVLILAFATGVF